MEDALGTTVESLERKNVTQLLERIRAGDDAAKPVLLEVAYRELRGIAGNLFKEQAAGHTLQPTALVNEVCVKMLGSAASNWNDHKHFVRAAALAMRNLLADHAKAKRAEKRGSGAATVELNSSAVPSGTMAAIDLVVLDETLTRLAVMDPRLGLIFELRFLAGLSVARTAEIADVSERTVELDTQFVRAWLAKELKK